MLTKEEVRWNFLLLKLLSAFAFLPISVQFFEGKIRRQAGRWRMKIWRGFQNLQMLYVLILLLNIEHWHHALRYAGAVFSFGLSAWIAKKMFKSEMNGTLIIFNNAYPPTAVIIPELVPKHKYLVGTAANTPPVPPPAAAASPESPPNPNPADEPPAKNPYQYRWGEYSISEIVTVVSPWFALNYALEFIIFVTMEVHFYDYQFAWSAFGSQNFIFLKKCVIIALEMTRFANWYFLLFMYVSTFESGCLGMINQEISLLREKSERKVVQKKRIYAAIKLGRRIRLLTQIFNSSFGRITLMLKLLLIIGFKLLLHYNIFYFVGDGIFTVLKLLGLFTLIFDKAQQVPQRMELLKKEFYRVSGNVRLKFGPKYGLIAGRAIPKTGIKFLGFYTQGQRSVSTTTWLLAIVLF